MMLQRILFPSEQFGARVSVEVHLRPRLDDVDVAVAETHSVPDEVSVSDAGGLVPPAQVDYVLESFPFLPSVASVDHKLLELLALGQHILVAVVEPGLGGGTLFFVKVDGPGFGQLGLVFLGLLGLGRRRLVESFLIFLLLNSC